jgi:hypothetical protein
MRKRAILSCILLAGALGGIPAGGTTPAGAQAAPNLTVVGGNFSGDARDESFWYVPGPYYDYLISSSNGGVPGGQINETEYRFNITKSYRPFAGNFDGDAYDELFLYAPGSAADAIWHWPANSYTAPVSRPISVGGNYTPLVGDFNGDNIDDIFWYTPGSGADSMWYFRSDGSHVSVARNVTRSYRPTVASVGKDATDDIIWYAPGGAADTIWDFTYGTRNYTSKALTVNGSNYRPVGLDALGEGPRSEDIWWYQPGSGTDPFWTYYQGAKYAENIVPLGGNWKVAVGDYFGDGQEDVYLSDINLGYTLRDFTMDGDQPVYIDYNWRASSVSAAGGVGDAGGKGEVEVDGPHPIG